ncbi:MAG TPA: hypothetical protein VMC41_03315 [Candidatus Nanoarchaeia archaeon]|nr:hypothetical protein [Candidatus Nanoarchaeia archaeon]
MAMIKFSRVNQIIIYAVIFVLVAIFFFYFFHQAAMLPGNISQLPLSGRPVGNTINKTSININLDLLGTDKFMNLRSEAAPVTSFPSGKRNPFAPQ